MLQTCANGIPRLYNVGVCVWCANASHGAEKDDAVVVQLKGLKTMLCQEHDDYRGQIH